MLISPASRTWASTNDNATSDQKVAFIRLTHGLINRFVMAADAASLFGGAVLLRSPWFRQPQTLTAVQCALSGLIAAAMLVVVMRAMGAYRVERYTAVERSISDLLRAFVPAALLAAVPIWAYAPAVLQRPGWLLSWAGVLFVLLIAQRQLVRHVVRQVERRALLRRRVVIIGASSMGEDLVRQLTDPAVSPDYDIVGVFDDQPDGRPATMLAGVPVCGTIDDLIVYAQRHPVDLVVVAVPWDRTAAIFRLIEQVQWISADVVVPFEKNGYQPGFAQLVDVGGVTALQVLKRPFKGTEGLLKVIEDYTVATLGLLIASPIILLAALAIRLDSPGPIMFRQPRVGFNGRTFLICKLRTMKVDPTDDGTAGTHKHDPRITRVGAFLRRTSIDEIPQLLNVLTGDMSVVGPRPHVPRMLVGDEVYTEAVRRYAARHRIKPGITGWAQINGMRGGIHSVAKAERGVELDLHYVAHWSVGLDLLIMIRTLIIGMAGRDVF